MCGIVGWLKKDGQVDQGVFKRMVQTLHHRGPDDSGTYFSDNDQYAIGHTRLSFLDLSEKGHQPYIDSETHCVLSFNGEIYNYLELREDLQSSYTYKTDSDTEVIMAAYLRWGLDFVHHLEGMFAIAILDQVKNELILVRDRFGIKPLYYTLNSSSIIFASELKAILENETVQHDVDFGSFMDYFVYRYVPSPKTIWKGIAKLVPANYLVVSLEDFSAKEYQYWKLNPDKGRDSFEQACKKVDDYISKSVHTHLRSDVEIGSFLSGGYDSSALALYMSKQGYLPATFSIGFEDWESSEHKYAQRVAKHLNLSNEATIVNKDALNTIDLMPDVYDEPIADISIIPTYLVSQLARKKVKSVFSGEGADELFGGYTWQHDFFAKTHPPSLVEKFKRMLKPPDTVDFYAEQMSMGLFDDQELRSMLHEDYHQFIPEDVNWFYRKNFNKNTSPLKSIQLLDIKCFMGELVLTKIDRASMVNSLEVRVPFLDHHLFEYVFSIKEETYYKSDQTKSLLYCNIKEDLPDEILQRPKQGFVGPDNYYMDIDWYKKELKNAVLVSMGIIKQEYIDTLLKKDYDWRLWKIIVMEKWFKRWVSQ